MRDGWIECRSFFLVGFFDCCVPVGTENRTGKFLRLCERIITNPNYDILMRVIQHHHLQTYYAHTMDTTITYLISLHVVDMWLKD